jgi:hypothetical protein
MHLIFLILIVIFYFTEITSSINSKKNISGFAPTKDWQPVEKGNP